MCFGQVWIKLHRFKSGFLCLQKGFFPVGSRVAGKNSVSFSQTGVGRSVIWIARDHLLKEIDGTRQIIAAALIRGSIALSREGHAQSGLPLVVPTFRRFLCR